MPHKTMHGKYITPCIMESHTIKDADREIYVEDTDRTERTVPLNG